MCDDDELAVQSQLIKWKNSQCDLIGGDHTVKLERFKDIQSQVNLKVDQVTVHLMVQIDLEMKSLHELQIRSRNNNKRQT